MGSGTIYKIAEDKVAHEVIDEEVVVIHFDSGNYYSLKGTAAQLWRWLCSSPDRAQIIQAFGSLTSEQVASVDTFIQSLVTEGILLEQPGTAFKGELPPSEEAFTPPTFEKYNDMQNLLLSDPIHDVDEMGWPHLEPDGH